MDIPFDLFAGRPIGLAKSDPVGAPALDWPGLAARLAAAHVARQILAVSRRPGDAPAGSFAPEIAGDLTAWRSCSSPGVNLTAKADGKPRKPIGRNDAGDDRSIVRGQL